MQYSSDVGTFWGDKSALALGAAFKKAGMQAPPRLAVTEVRRPACCVTVLA